MRRAEGYADDGYRASTTKQSWRQMGGDLRSLSVAAFTSIWGGGRRRRCGGPSPSRGCGATACRSNPASETAIRRTGLCIPVLLLKTKVPQLTVSASGTSTATYRQGVTSQRIEHLS